MTLSSNYFIDKTIITTSLVDCHQECYELAITPLEGESMHIHASHDALCSLWLQLTRLLFPRIVSRLFIWQTGLTINSRVPEETTYLIDAYTDEVNPGLIIIAGLSGVGGWKLLLDYAMAYHLWMELDQLELS